MTGTAEKVPVSKAAVEAAIAERERDVDVQERVHQELMEVCDAAYRQLLRMRSDLTAFRETVAARVELVEGSDD